MRGSSLGAAEHYQPKNIHNLSLSNNKYNKNKTYIGKNHSNNLLKQSMQSSRRGVNTGLFPEDNGSEDSGNVTSESELDMNAEVPSQVLLEMGV